MPTEADYQLNEIRHKLRQIYAIVRDCSTRTPTTGDSIGNAHFRVEGSNVAVVVHANVYDFQDDENRQPNVEAWVEIDGKPVGNHVTEVLIGINDETPLLDRMARAEQAKVRVLATLAFHMAERYMQASKPR